MKPKLNNGPKVTWLPVTEAEARTRSDSFSQRLRPQNHPPPGGIQTQGLYLRQHLILASSSKSNSQQIIGHRRTLQADEAVALVLRYPAQHGIPVGLKTTQKREADGEPAHARSSHFVERSHLGPAAPNSLLRVWRKGQE